MPSSRRTLIRMISGAALLPFAGRIGRAETFPAGPIRLIVPFAAGGGTDIVARLISHSLAARLGQPIVIENKPGAGTNLGTEMVVRSRPDGYTLLLASPPNVINTTLYKNLSFNFVRHTTPVASIVRGPLIVAVNPSLPVKTLDELISYARQRGSLSMASAGVGSTSHLAGELFKMMSGIDLLHVPYRGTAPALTDLMGGQVQVMFVTSTGAIDYVRSGSLRALAVTSERRSPELPDLPAVGEIMPGYEASTWYGIVAPADTPSNVIARLNDAANASLVDPKLRTRLTELGGAIVSGSSEEFGRLISSEAQKWGEVVRYAKATVE